MGLDANDVACCKRRYRAQRAQAERWALILCSPRGGITARCGPIYPLPWSISSTGMTLWGMLQLTKLQGGPIGQRSQPQQPATPDTVASCELQVVPRKRLWPLLRPATDRQLHTLAPRQRQP
jgi:hypothetical protein